MGMTDGRAKLAQINPGAVLADGLVLRERDVASGRQRTWAERWKLRNALVLFNPAPVT